MIKAGIAGADTPMAGELIRILVNHPDVDLVSISAPRQAGRKVADFHHGLTGELDLRFNSAPDPSALDVLFLDAFSDADFIDISTKDYDGLRIIDMSHLGRGQENGAVYGLPEIYRKALVRGATRAAVPRSIAGVALIALYPLALNLMLKGDVNIHVDCPDDIVADGRLKLAEMEIADVLRDVQQSFSGNVTVTHHSAGEDADPRALSMTLDLDNSIAVEELERIYSELYSDHNFTFLSSKPELPEQVVGTDKCLLSLSRESGDSLRINAVADCRMRGGAGDAVHAMNLMFGLTERTGLYLKAHKY